MDPEVIAFRPSPVQAERERIANRRNLAEHLRDLATRIETDNLWGAPESLIVVLLGEQDQLQTPFTTPKRLRRAADFLRRFADDPRGMTKAQHCELACDRIPAKENP